MNKTERSYTDRALNKQCGGFASVNTSEIGSSLLFNDSATAKAFTMFCDGQEKYLSPVVNFKIYELKVSDSC